MQTFNVKTIRESCVVMCNAFLDAEFNEHVKSLSKLEGDIIEAFKGKSSSSEYNEVIKMIFDDSYKLDYDKLYNTRTAISFFNNKERIPFGLLPDESELLKQFNEKNGCNLTISKVSSVGILGIGPSYFQQFPKYVIKDEHFVFDGKELKIYNATEVSIELITAIHKSVDTLKPILEEAVTELKSQWDEVNALHNQMCETLNKFHDSIYEYNKMFKDLEKSVSNKIAELIDGDHSLIVVDNDSVCTQITVSGKTYDIPVGKYLLQKVNDRYSLSIDGRKNKIWIEKANLHKVLRHFAEFSF